VGEAPVGMEPSAHPGDQLPSLGTILLVEDEPGVRAFAARVLDDAGYRVIEAGSGSEAMALLPEVTTPLTLLISDVVMPGMNGRMLAERLRVIHPGLPVLYMSGYTDDMVLRAGVTTDAASFIQKPFMPEQLLERVRRAITSSSHHPAR
jgi:two-component system cell cycle sensor histidine kinase/response regulator CckA